MSKDVLTSYLPLIYFSQQQYFRSILANLPHIMQPASNQQQSLHSIKLQLLIPSIAQSHQPHPQQIHRTNRAPSLCSSRSQLSPSQPQQPQLESLAHLHSHKKKHPSSHQQKKSQISNFIIKTYRILEDPVNSNIIHWTDQGNAFIVKNKDKFENQILPKYFKHKKFSSFVRQLNMYDFHKIRKEKQIPIFKHKYFREGCIDLLCKIKRKSGEQAGGLGQDDDQAHNDGTRNYIPSLLDLADKPLPSAYSFKSKSHLPYPSMLPSQPSIGLLPASAHGSELELLIQQNHELTASVSELAREQAGLELQRERKRQKIMKILSVLVNVDLSEGVGFGRDVQEYFYCESGLIENMRDLENHFGSEEEPFSFVEYGNFMREIYKKIKRNLGRMQMETKEESEEHKIEEERQ